MNNYVDYYNYMNNINQNRNSNQMKLGYDTEAYLGFIRGNMFSNLYEPYQNYQIQELNPNNEQEYLLLLVQMYGFAAHDLGLYLDVNPNDGKAIDLRNNYINLYNQSLANYESKYGPLTLNSQGLDTKPWAWNTKKWPWEGNK